MKNLGAVLVLLLASCTQSLGDLPDLAGGHHDLAVVVDDLAVPLDLAMAGACTQVASWPGVQPVANFDPTQGDTFVISTRQMMEPQDILAIEDWHLSGGTDGGERYPKMASFAATDTYATCDLCVRLFEGCTKASGCMRGYFAQAGSLTVTRADSNPITGRMTVSGANVKLVEWTFPMADADGGITGDKPVAGGRCWEVASLSLDVPWDNTVGADGGVACHPVVNEIMTAGASASDELIELYNPCAQAIDLSGWKLAYRSSGNNNGRADTALTTFAAGTMIAAGGYLVGVNKALTTRAHDFTYGGGLSGGGGAVGLRDAAAALIDSVAYQTLTVPNTFTEGTPAPNPPAGSSIGRFPNGTDNQDNGADFHVTASPTPGAANN